ncbi:MAG: FAD-binding oxidoreductase [Candidatus Binatia bacterium]|nr:FAD-binding oxidoreductase [Candidatus Binatia bacterium]
MGEPRPSGSIPLDFARLGVCWSESPEDRRRFAIDGREPQWVVFPETVDQVTGVLRQAHGQRLAVAPVGSGAFLHLGGVPRRYQLALSLQKLTRLVDYQPTDMTVTVEAGMTLERLQERLAEQGQWLPLDPPLPQRVTLGGIIAANLSGPARLSQGTIRDLLLGLRVVQADGTVVKGGGRVVKNVAGYDLPKLYCGSLGTLGVIVEATCKVRPRPPVQTVLSLTYPAPTAAMELVLRILASELQPFSLVLTNFHPLADYPGDTGSYPLFVSFAGIPEEVSYQRHRLQELALQQPLQEWEGEVASLLRDALRDFPVTGNAALRCKLSILPAQVGNFYQECVEEAAVRSLPVQLLAHAGNGIVYVRVFGAEGIPEASLLSWVDWLRIAARRRAGYLVVESLAPHLKERIDVWGAVGSAFPVMKKLKETLDPDGILNPGRFIGGM